MTKIKGLILRWVIGMRGITSDLWDYDEKWEKTLEAINNSIQT